MKKTVAVIGIALVLLGIFASIEAPVALVVGWIPFLATVLPRMTVDWPSLIVAGIALAVFTAGVHWACRAWRQRAVAEDPTRSGSWRLRSSFAVVAAIFLLFASGIAIVGATHQVIWLGTSKRPMLVPGSPFGLHAKHSAVAIQTTNYMKQTALAFHSVHDWKKQIPAGVYSPEGKMLHSWETSVLPGVIYSTEGIDLARPWNDPVNDKLFKCIIPEFVNNRLATTEVVNADGYGLNHYSANVHVLGPDRQVRTFEDFKDGISNTLLFGEITAHFRPWAQPGNWRDPALGLNRFPGGFGGPTGDGAYFAFADGSVRFVSDRVSLETLRALGTPSGGEKVPDWD